MQKLSIKRKETVVVLSALLLGLALIYSPFALTWQTQAAGTITGRVFQDYNANGLYDTSGSGVSAAVDRGLAGVTVTAYDSAGAAQGSTTTLADGTYSLAATGIGPYRVEFTTLPANYSPSARSTDSVDGGTGTDSGTVIQFVPDGNTADVNLAINRPNDYCQDNPLLVTTCFVGTILGNPANPDNPVLISFPYNSGTTSTTSSSGVQNPTTHALMVPQSQAGSVWGIAQHRSSQQVFTSAFTKRHAGFRNDLQGTGSDPTGEIFIANRSGTTASLFLNLNTLFGSDVAGVNPHDVSNPNPGGGNSSYFNDLSAFDAVGKTALGDIDISDDNQTLFAVNLADRNLYAIPLGTGTPTAPTNAGDVSVYNLVGLAAGATCPSTADLRPGALKYHNGTLYYGLTCTAQTAGTAADLRAFVYSLDLTGAGTATQVANIQLNYSRGFVMTDGVTPAPADWLPWTANTGDVIQYVPSGQFYYPQPWLLDIEFDKDNSMILGVADRAGHQLGNDRSLTNPNEPVEVVSAGDTLRLTPGGALVGGGEYYNAEGYTINNDTHQEISLGGLLQVPGFNEVLIAAFDPAPTNFNPDTGLATIRAGGVIWLNNTTGTRARSYQLYDSTATDGEDAFGKAAGIGDIEAFCDVAPIEIGNRVWNDTNGDGVQDPNEPGIGSVTVRLYKSNVLLATAVTDANGEYYFVSGTAADPNISDNIGNVNGPILPNMDYEVRFDNPADYTGAGPLAGLIITQQNQTSQLGFDEGSDSDASLVTNPVNSPAGVFAVIPVTTGASGQNNHNIDAGFSPTAAFSLGNRVWFDTNDDGQINAGEIGISGVSVSVLDSGNNVINTVTTDGNGYYRFDGLAAGDYTVRINASNFADGGVLAGYRNTTITDGTDNDSTAVAGQNGENGINPTGTANSVQTNGISSGTITLGSPGEPTSEADVATAGIFAGQGAIDPAANMTVDFGFYCLSISGTLWLDNGAGGGVADNGILDGTEPTLPFLRMRLFDSAGNEIPVGNDGILGTSDDASNSFSADASGNYNFSCLAPEQYRIVVDRGGTSSTPTSLNPDDNVDSDDNGDPGTGQFSGSTISNLVTLTPGNVGAQSNNTVTNSTGRTADPTIDFGFVDAPTAIKLKGFDVFTNGTQVFIEWATGQESNNLGFNIYREVGGVRELITKAPIAGSSLRSRIELQTTGEGYQWQDATPKAGAVYYLEDIDMNGQATMHGPVYPQMRLLTKGSMNLLDRQNAPLLTELTRVDNSSAQREFIQIKNSNETDNFVQKSNAVERTQWDIAGQFGAKISVSQDGWYRVPAEDLRSVKFNSNADRTNWQLYADGQEVPIKLGADGSIQFYGQGLDIPTTDTRTYFLIKGQSPGLRLNQVDGGSAENTQVAPNFDITIERKDRMTYVSSILNGEEENWFGAVVSPNAPTNQELIVNNIDNVGQSRLSLELQGLTATEHLVSVRFNDVDLGTVALNDQENKTFEFDLPSSSVIEGANNVTLQSVGTGSDISLVDTIRLTYPRRYEAIDGKLRFSIPAGQTVRFGGFDENTVVNLYEINRAGRVEREVLASEENSDGVRRFSLAAAGYEREMLAIAEMQAVPVDMLERNIPSSWNKSSNEADFVIIVPYRFYKYVERIAVYRRNQGLQTKVVYIEDLYDEFSFGRHSPEAIRTFLERATTNWNVKPQYALLFGDSSFDPRNYLGQTDLDLVPTKLIDTQFYETSSDAWLADFDNDGVEDIALGRLPASNSAEVEIIMRKWMQYERQAVRRNRSSVMISDNGFETYNDLLEANLPEDVETTRIERSGLTDTQMHGQLLERLSANPQIVTYTGHGSGGLWANADVFTLYDAGQLTNRELSLYLLMTCENGFTNSPYNSSMAEELVKSRTGGAALVWASSGTTYSHNQFEMTQIVTNLIFNSGSNTRIGDMLREAKQGTQDRDVRQTWTLIGDPTAGIK